MVLKKIRTFLHRRMSGTRRLYLTKVWGMTLGEGSRISLKADLDFTNPSGIHIGAYTMVTPRVQIFTHDFVRARHVDTYIGDNCFIGAGAIILPGVRIGDRCIVAAGSVVSRDVPQRSLVAGNPARVIRSDIRVGHYGMMVGRTVA
ncbi:acyltransferase [Erythrobacter sp. 3-20A1M]|nr:acyltransferase [Erythrobacter sp. 3-20A1M]